MAADNAVFYAASRKGIFNSVGLGVHSVKNRMGTKGLPLADVFENTVGNVASLVLLVGSGIDLYLIPCTFLSPKSLALSADVVENNLIGGIENIARRAIIFFQADNLCIGIMLLEA